ncbi:MAG: aldehyde ferredoxin oxidoreductase [Anaerolineales bacterium]|nr:aldehyde ferredoxin oxidoreductase [Anaerolineales bacterium]
MKVWRINVRKQALQIENVPETWQGLGGRGLTARILLDEVNPECDPLGSENKLIFAPGLLVGHRLSSCDRISVGTKSPLTKGIKEANAGGRTGFHLTQLGIKVLIIEGSPTDEGFWVLVINKQGAAFKPAGDLVGKGAYETASRLIEGYGEDPAIALIGPGGEMRLTAAGILNIDKDLVPSRISARGGVGAVMGAKGLKAIVIDASEGEAPPIVDLKTFREAQKEFNKALLEHPQITAYAEYGTAGMAMISNGFGGLPTRNFSSGEFEGADEISGEFLRDLLVERGGKAKTTHACMTGCTIRCSNIFAGQDGKEVIVSPLEYETIALMGSNLGISDLDVIAKLNWQVNDLGIDSIEIGAALGVAAEGGAFEFGDGQSALALLEEIRTGSELGKVLGNGAVATGKHLGVERVPVVKGQAMSAYDPRAIKGTGVTYATSPQGADHTSGLTIRSKVDHLDPEGQVELSRNSQINVAGYDTLGACAFASFGFAAAPETITALLNARYGGGFGEDTLRNLGKETIKLEREFNKRAGFTKEDDRLPAWMKEEPLPPHNAVFDVLEDEMDHIFDDL